MGYLSLRLTQPDLHCSGRPQINRNPDAWTGSRNADGDGGGPIRQKTGPSRTRRQVNEVTWASALFWSLTQFYSVSFIQSRIKLWSCFSTNTQSRFASIHSVRCMHAVVCKVYGYCFRNFEKSQVFNLRCQKVCTQCRSYLKCWSQGIISPLDPFGGQKIQCFIKWEGLSHLGGLYWGAKIYF